MVAATAARAFKGVADAAVVVRRTPSVTVAANRCALSNGLQHRSVILEDQQVFWLPLPALDGAPVAP
ncbi:hypothetical protein D3C75_799960 [compost metagenome]